jgi:hypothetical protein
MTALSTRGKGPIIVNDTRVKLKMTKQKIEKLILKCDCGCTSQIMVQLNGDCDDLQVDCRDDGRHKWHGVWLDTKNKVRIIDFLNKGGGRK